MIKISFREAIFFVDVSPHLGSFIIFGRVQEPFLSSIKILYDRRMQSLDPAPIIDANTENASPTVGPF